MKRPARDGWVRQRTDPDPAVSYGAGFQSEDTMTSLTATQPPPTEVDAPPDALTLLIADHYHLHNLFAHFEHALSTTRKEWLRDQICRELGVHMQIEEEILYPAIPTPADQPLMVTDATVEHAGIKHLIGQLCEADVDHPATLRQMLALSACMTRHVHEEHNTLFPRVWASSVDIAALGVRLAARQRELLA